MHLKNTNFILLCTQKKIPTAVGQDIGEKNNEEKWNLWNLSMFIKLVAIK